MTIARIENGAVLEYRDINLEDVPEHKRTLWVPVVYEGEGDSSNTTVETDRVLITFFDASPTVPQIISDRQFFQALAGMQIITTEEALAAVGPGTIPAALDAMVQGLPQQEQFPARMLLTGATQFDRNHPMVAVFGVAFGWTPEQLDSFWIEAHQL